MKILSAFLFAALCLIFPAYAQVINPGGGSGGGTSCGTGSGNKVCATPSDGSSGASALRALTTADVAGVISTGLAPYTATVTAQTTLTVAAATHGQGTTPVAACFDNSTPAAVVACSYTVSAAGQVVFTWSPAFTGSITIIGGGTGPTGAAGATGATGPTGPAGSPDITTNMSQLTGNSTSATCQITDNPLSSGATTINVTSGCTSTYAASGYLWLRHSGATGSELVSYTGKATTTFTGVTRGLFTTTATSQAVNTFVLPVEYIEAASTSSVPTVTIVRFGAGGSDRNCIYLGATQIVNGSSCVTNASTQLFLDASISGSSLTNFLLNGGVFSSGSGSSTYLRTASGQTINIGDNQAQTITINSSTGATTLGGTGTVTVNALKTTGAATGKTVVCVDTATGILYASTSAVTCAN